MLVWFLWNFRNRKVTIFYFRIVLFRKWKCSYNILPLYLRTSQMDIKILQSNFSQLSWCPATETCITFLLQHSNCKFLGNTRILRSDGTSSESIVFGWTYFGITASVGALAWMLDTQNFFFTKISSSVVRHSW